MKKKLGNRIVSCGHQPRGEAHYNAKITEAKAQEVLFLSGSGYTNAQISRLTNVPVGSVGMIVSGRRWKHLAIKRPQLKNKWNTGKRLTNENVQYIRRAYENGWKSQHQLANELGVSQCTISETVNGNNHRCD